MWAALRSLGRSGLADLVDRLAAHARALAGGIATIPHAEILNDVVFTHCDFAYGAVRMRLLAAACIRSACC